MEETNLEFELTKLLGIENKMLIAAEKSIENVNNILIHTLLTFVIMDSKQHSLILNTALKLLLEDDLSLSDQDKDEIGKRIGSHIEVEEEGIKILDSLDFTKIENEMVAQLLKYLLSEERRHHALLMSLVKLIKQESSQGKEVWNLFWQMSNIAEKTLRTTY